MRDLVTAWPRHHPPTNGRRATGGRPVTHMRHVHPRPYPGEVAGSSPATGTTAPEAVAAHEERSRAVGDGWREQEERIKQMSGETAKARKVLADVAAEAKRNVNRGIGMEGGSTPRVRFWARPEVTVIDILPK